MREPAKDPRRENSAAGEIFDSTSMSGSPDALSLPAVGPARISVDLHRSLVNTYCALMQIFVNQSKDVGKTISAVVREAEAIRDTPPGEIPQNLTRKLLGRACLDLREQKLLLDAVVWINSILHDPIVEAGILDRHSIGAALLNLRECFESTPIWDAASALGHPNGECSDHSLRGLFARHADEIGEIITRAEDRTRLLR